MRTNETRKCIIWGAGYFGQYIQEAVRERGYDIVAYCDEKKTGKVEDVNIITIEAAIDLCSQNKEIEIVIGVKKRELESEIEKMITSRFPDYIVYHRGMEIYSYIQERQLKSFYHNMQYSWHVDLKKEFLRWLENIGTEVEYWVKDVADVRGISNIYNTKCRDNSLFLHDGLAENVKENSIVLDIGCGLISQFGDILPNGNKIRLLPVDALAHYYNRINACINDGRKSDYKCHFGMFEFVANIFGEEFADAIIINNALDHCIDPFRSLVECLYVLKRGGRLHMRHRRAEAVYEKWSGLHRWNVDCINGSLVLWNKENAINVSEALSECVEIDVRFNKTADRENQMLDVMIIKKENFLIEKFINKNDDADILISCVASLMKQQAKNSVFFENMLADAKF